MVTNNEKSRKGLSKEESKLLSRLSSKGKKIIEISDIKDSLDVTYKNAKKIASDLKKKGWLDRLQRGKYIIVPLEAGEKGTFTEHEFLIASELVSPYYVGFLSALNFHGLTEQTPMSTFVATTKRARNRTIHSIPYYFVTLKGGKFFGIKEYSVAGKAVRISDPEKTLVDCLDHLEHCGGIEQVVNGLKEETYDLEKLVRYSVRSGNGAAIKRLDYLLNLLGRNIPDSLEERLKDNYSRSYSLLDSTKSDRGKYSSEWMLRINISKKEMLGDTY